MNQKQKQSRRQSRRHRRQNGGSSCNMQPLGSAPVGGSKRNSQKQRKRNQNKSKKGGLSGSLAALGLLGTLLAVGSKKRKSHKRRGTKKGMTRKTARKAYMKRK